MASHSGTDDMRMLEEARNRGYQLYRIGAEFWIIVFTLFLLLHSGSLLSSAVLSLTVACGLTALLRAKSIPKVSSGAVSRALGRSRANWQVIAHRGGGHDAPENTLQAFTLAAGQGASGVEFDLEFTRDGRPVLLHDDTVERTTDGRGRVAGLHYDTVHGLNAAARHHRATAAAGESVPFEPVPTLEATVERCLELGLNMFIDVKRNHPLVIPVLVGLYKKWPRLYEEAFVCSFYPHIIYKLRVSDPGIVCGLTWRPHVLTYRNHLHRELRNVEWWRRAAAPVGDLLLRWAVHSWLWYLCGVSVFLVNKSVCSIDYIREWRGARGVEPILWTVNTSVEKAWCVSTLECAYMTDTTAAHTECADDCTHEA